MQIRTSLMLPEEAYFRVQALVGCNYVSSAWVKHAAVVEFLDQHNEQSELLLRLPKTGKVAS